MVRDFHRITGATLSEFEAADAVTILDFIEIDSIETQIIKTAQENK